MDSVTERIIFDVSLSKEEIAALERMLKCKAKFKIVPDARLEIRVQVEVRDK